MTWYKPNTWFKKNENLNEAVEAFKEPKETKKDTLSSEGIDSLPAGLSSSSVGSFNSFYNNYINKQLLDRQSRIKEYRNIASAPEVADVIDDAVIESTREDRDGNIVHLKVNDEKISNNDNIMKNLNHEFKKLFYERLEIDRNIEYWFRRLMIDAEFFAENIINENKKKEGIQKIKPLPTETMDYIYDYKSGKILAFLQYLKNKSTTKPKTLEEAKNDQDVIVFYPDQISYVNYGMYDSKKQVYGYLDTAKQPYNSLKMLETSVIIYRIIRAPERLVFKVDVGNMPREKAMKFVNKVKNRMEEKQTFNPDTGQMTKSNAVMSMLSNYWLPTCLTMDTEILLLDGRIITLKDLENEYLDGKENWVYSVNQNTGEFIPGKIKWAGTTIKNSSLVRVTLDNDETIECTPDHKFVMRDGSEVEAQHLKEDDSIMPLTSKIKIKKVEFLDYKEDVGCLTIEDPGKNHNFALASGIFVKNSPDGRGSDISSIGGNPSGFSELDDIYYFQRKLYRALKYPMSRVTMMQEKQSGDIVFGGSRFGEIPRDEVKWSVFLEKQQNKFCSMFKHLFLKHLEFIGYKSQYKLDSSKINVTMNIPNNYQAQIQQQELQTRVDNYMNLSNSPEFSKSFLMSHYLGWDDEKIKQNVDGMKKDKELGIEEDSGF